MQSFLALFNWVAGHATKILGFVTVTVSYLSSEGVIPPGHLKFYTIVLGLFMVWRGFFTGNAYNKGVADGAANPPTPLFSTIVLKPSSPESK